MKIILAPIDFSDVTREIVDRTAELASAMNAKIHLLHIATPSSVSFNYMIEGGGYIGPAQDLCTNEAAIEDKRRQLEGFADSLRERGLIVECVVMEGLPTDIIVEDAKSLNAEMIVIGSHGHGSLYHLILGSVSEGVMRKADCPVLIVHSRHNANKMKESA